MVVSGPVEDWRTDPGVGGGGGGCGGVLALNNAGTHQETTVDRERHGCADLSSRAGDVTLRTSGRWGALFSHGGDTLMLPANRKKFVFS